MNWLADVCCLVCAMFALGVPVPWAKILVAWTAASGAASFSPVPGGIGVVEVVLIAALVGVGVRAPAAVATTLLYRFLTFKIAPSVVWFGYYYLRQRRAAAAPVIWQCRLVPAARSRHRCRASQRRRPWTGRRAPEMSADPLPPLRADSA